MKQVVFEKATVACVSNALRNMRESHENREAILRDAILSADRCWVASVDGEVACIWGLQFQNVSLGHVYLWVITTKVAEANWLRFTRKSKEFIDSLAEQYRFINGHVSPNGSRRWIEWLGFTIGEKLPPVDAYVFWKGER